MSHTFRETLKVRFFSFFSVGASTVVCSMTFDLDVLVVSPSTVMFSGLPSEFSGAASTDMLGVPVVEFSKVKFFLGTSTHSDISMTASALVKESVPLLLREKCKVALIGEERLRDEYLNKSETIASELKLKKDY